MKKKSKEPLGREPEQYALRTVGPNGEAPDSRLRNAAQAYEVCRELDINDRKRRKKRNRIFKAYNRFPPTDYSLLAKRHAEWQSNVNFGMLAFVIDNNLASFYDMLSERTETAEIVTKKGNLKEKKEWSELISTAFDKALQRWDEFLLNQEQDLLDMLLFGKGVEMWDGNDGWCSEHVSADEVLVPDHTKINFCNFTEVAIKWTFQLHELYEAIQDQKSSEDMGWNVEAVIEAMRWKRDLWRSKTSDEFLKDIKEGNITIAGHLKESVEVYILFVKEFDGQISKHIVLRDYAQALVNQRMTGEKVDFLGTKSDKDAINRMGFLFSKTKMFQSYKNVFAVFIDNAGSGKWHNTPSLAEKIFVQCRQYDFAMNAIMDAIKINMSLILTGGTAEATEKLKEIVFGPYTIIPADLQVAQHRLNLPTNEATQALQFLMLDMNRGIGNYRIHEKGTGGEAPTATQTRLDAAEAAKLTGTQLRRFNSQHSLYYRELYRRLVSCTDGEEGYETYKEFRDYLKANKVPEVAWKHDNIDTIKSNMLSGAGSPSYKLMAAKEIISITNISPKDQGQANACRDAIASLAGRPNVGRYMPEGERPDLTWNERIIGFENETMESPILNPQNVQVHPNDNHVEHIIGHLNDMARTIAVMQKAMQEGKIKKEDAMAGGTKMLNTGGHVSAHMQFLARDEGKQDMVKKFAADLSGIQREADQLAQQFSQKLKADAEATTGNLENDPEMRKQIALSQIQIHTKEQLSKIQLGAIAQKHQARVELDKDRAANQIAIERAKAQDQLQEKMKARRKL